MLAGFTTYADLYKTVRGMKQPRAYPANEGTGKGKSQTLARH